MASDDKLRIAAANRHAVHALETQLARSLDAVDRHPTVPGIGKIDRAVRTYADIVRAVEFLTFEVRCEDFATAFALTHERRGGVLADHQRQVGIVGHTVALVG